MRYREVIRPSFWLLSFIYFLFLSLVVSIWAALGNTPALISLVFLTASLALTAKRMEMVIEVNGGELRIDRAHIDFMYLGKVTALSADEMKKIRTRDADPAAYLAIRFWVSAGVKVEIKDPRDTTPYWIISTKRGEDLVKALKN
jgi:hypothetical protein